MQPLDRCGSLRYYWVRARRPRTFRVLHADATRRLRLDLGSCDHNIVVAVRDRHKLAQEKPIVEPVSNCNENRVWATGSALVCSKAGRHELPLVFQRLSVLS